MSAIVLDSSAWVEFFADRPKSGLIEPLLDKSEIVVPSVVIYEVYRRLKSGVSSDAADAAAERMLSCSVHDLDSDAALLAADLSIEHRLPMADAMVLAAARLNDVELITLDSDFKGIRGVTLL